MFHRKEALMPRMEKTVYEDVKLTAEVSGKTRKVIATVKDVHGSVVDTFVVGTKTEKEKEKGATKKGTKKK